MDLVELWKAEQLAHWQNVAADVQRKRQWFAVRVIYGGEVEMWERRALDHEDARRIAEGQGAQVLSVKAS